MASSNQAKPSFRITLLLFLSGVIILSIFVMASSEWKYPLSGHPDFTTGIRLNYKKDMDAIRPDIVLIGDSTLRWGVDEDRLSEGLGKKVYKIGIQGSASALWYLLVKNNILDGEHKPEAIVIFFRDTMLTIPEYRVYGDYFAKIDEYGNENDPVLIAKAYNRPVTAIEWLMVRLVPVYAERLQLQNGWNAWMQPLLARWLQDCDDACIEDAKAEVFSFPRQNPEVYGRNVMQVEGLFYQFEHLLFSRSYGDSFLGDLIRLTRAENTRLILVRLGTTRFSSEQDEPLLLRRYLEDLSNKMEQEGVDYIGWDYQSIPLSGYMDAIHMNAEGNARYTEWLLPQLMAKLQTDW